MSYCGFGCYFSVGDDFCLLARREEGEKFDSFLVTIDNFWLHSLSLAATAGLSPHMDDCFSIRLPGSTRAQ